MRSLCHQPDATQSKQHEVALRDDSREEADGEASKDIWIGLLRSCVRLPKNKVGSKGKEVHLCRLR